MDNLLSERRILVLEDEMLILMSIEDMLGDLGCESVSAATTIDQALACIEAQPIDAAIIDMDLRGQSSRPVAEALVARGIPFVFCTGSRQSDLWSGFRDRGILGKPFTYDDLVGVLTRLLPSAAFSALTEVRI